MVAFSLLRRSFFAADRTEPDYRNGGSRLKAPAVSPRNFAAVTCAKCRLPTAPSTWSSTSARAFTSADPRLRSRRSPAFSVKVACSFTRPRSASYLPTPAGRPGGGCHGRRHPSSRPAGPRCSGRGGSTAGLAIRALVARAAAGGLDVRRLSSHPRRRRSASLRRTRLPSRAPARHAVHGRQFPFPRGRAASASRGMNCFLKARVVSGGRRSFG